MVNAKQLLGRRIVGFDPGAIVVARSNSKFPVTLHDPVIFLDDGGLLSFVSEEHPDGGEPGVFIRKVKAKKPADCNTIVITLEVDDRFRKALSRHYGEKSRASDKTIRTWASSLLDAGVEDVVFEGNQESKEKA